MNLYNINTIKYKTLTEVYKLYYQRMAENFDYYCWDNESEVAIIHAKFGKLKKAVIGVTEENNLPTEFVEEFMKYWNNEPSTLFETEQDIITYIVKNNLPVIIYSNFTDTEMTLENILEYFGMSEELLEYHFNNNYKNINFKRPYNILRFATKPSVNGNRKKLEINLTTYQYLEDYEASSTNDYIEIKSKDFKEIKEQLIKLKFTIPENGRWF